MKTLNYLPISSVISDYLEDYDTSSLKEEVLFKWAIDIVDQIITDQQLVNKVMLLDVRGHKAELPKDFQTVCEVAYRKKQPKTSNSRIEKVSKWIQQTDNDCQLEISVNCPDCHNENCDECDKNYIEVEVDKIWQLSNPQYHYLNKFSRAGHFGKGDQSSVYSDEFKLLKYSGSNQWSGIKHIPECANVHCEDCEESYEFVGRNIETSFREGTLLVSYLAKKTDKFGDLMVPDHPLVLETISDYIIYKMMKRDYVKTKKAEDYRALKEFEQSYERSLMRARTTIGMFSYNDYSEWLKNNKYSRMDASYDRLIKTGTKGPGYRPTRKDQYR